MIREQLVLIPNSLVDREYQTTCISFGILIQDYSFCDDQSTARCLRGFFWRQSCLCLQLSGLACNPIYNPICIDDMATCKWIIEGKWTS